MVVGLRNCSTPLLLETKRGLKGDFVRIFIVAVVVYGSGVVSPQIGADKLQIQPFNQLIVNVQVAFDTEFIFVGDRIIFNVLGVLVWLAFIPQLADVVRAISPSSDELQGLQQAAADIPRQIANAHTVFNIANLLVVAGIDVAGLAVAIPVATTTPVAMASGARHAPSEGMSISADRRR